MIRKMDQRDRLSISESWFLSIFSYIILLQNPGSERGINQGIPFEMKFSMGCRALTNEE